MAFQVEIVLVRVNLALAELGTEQCWCQIFRQGMISSLHKRWWWEPLPMGSPALWHTGSSPASSMSGKSLETVLKAVKARLCHQVAFECFHSCFPLPFLVPCFSFH